MRVSSSAGFSTSWGVVLTRPKDTPEPDELHDDGLFAAVHVVFGVVTLNEEIDISLERLWTDCEPIGEDWRPKLLPKKFFSWRQAVLPIRCPEVGDVITFESSEEVGVTLVKRVVANEGQVIELRDGRLCVDGSALEDSYVDEGTNGDPAQAAGKVVA